MQNHFPKFFKNIDELHLATLQLDLFDDSLICCHCSSSGQFVSHGFVYKFISSTECKAVGKRILCSNRSNHSGCGKTMRLYVSERIPKLRYFAACVTSFVLLLIAGISIQAAYQIATGTSDPRHAYRWLNKLNHQFIRFRGMVYQRSTSSLNSVKRRSRRLLLLLPTLESLFALPHISNCFSVQISTQVAFF